MAEEPTAPLVVTERIVKENGTPTEYFISQWNLQRVANAVSVENTGVISGVYGDSTHVARVEVDARGRILSVVEVAITAVTGLVNKASSAVPAELAFSVQTEIAAVNIVKASSATAIILKLNYEAMNELIKWSDASIQFSRTDIKFAGGDGDSLPELIVKVDASVEGISHFIQTSFLYATKFVEVVIFGIAAGARTISVELNPQSTIMVRQRQITVLEM